jgi:Spy/CpxP family protein refolding chaperone
MRTAILLALLFIATSAVAQTPAPKPAAKPTKAQTTAAELQKTVDQLTQSNRDLLDLLKQQQAVLEDMQFDRRLQSRQIQSLEERLNGAMFDNNRLQVQVTKLEAQVSAPPTAAAPPTDAPKIDGTPQPAPPKLTEVPSPPDPPASYLPDAPPEDAPPGTLSWHRLFTLKGDDLKQTDIFQVRGRTWRVQWHNQDKPGKAFANTSALFINAFPKDDTIPQKVCAKLGSGGDATELQGPGNYYLKIEASGGSWELAVEDFR